MKMRFFDFEVLPNWWLCVFGDMPDDPKDIKEEIKDIENETLPQNNTPSKDDKKETEKVEKIEIAEDAFDSSPKTADSSDFGTWLAIMGISLVIAIGASLSLVITRKR